MILSLFKRSSGIQAARSLYGDVVRQARQPVFYGAGGVADTEDGRYDLILLHMFLILERLNRVSPEPVKLKQTKVCAGAFRRWSKAFTAA